MSRKLVTVRRVDSVEPIEGADAIEVAVFGGWRVVVKRGDFSEGDLAVYFEIDSFLPEGEPAWQFLVDKQPRQFNGRTGHRLKTVKLRGQPSQGLALHVAQLPAVQDAVDAHADEALEMDFAEALGVEKYEAPVPSQLAGLVEGDFPSFIPKTDEERCQNLGPDIFRYDDRLVPFDTEKVGQEVAEAMAARGDLKFKPAHTVGDDPGAIYQCIIQYDGVEVPAFSYKVLKAKASPWDVYEISVKLDGSSLTGFHFNGEVGVCSRNQQLKVCEANAGNTLVKMLLESGLAEALPKLGNIAVQGELMGPGIQKNREGLAHHALFVYKTYRIDEGRYETSEERAITMACLYEAGVDQDMVQHVPVLHEATTLAALGIADVEGLLRYAEGPSLKHPVREGLVFKRADGKFSFKAISNSFLLKEKD